jgi:hypothetical protein
MELKVIMNRIVVIGLAVVGMMFANNSLLGETIDNVLKAENTQLGVSRLPVGSVDDMAFIRRASVDLIGRIPDLVEVHEFQSWPAATRREQLLDKLIAHPRFADRWTVFFADLLRLRSNADGGAALVAYVHRAISDDQPYNELASALISTNGKAGRSPEVGFVLGDNADPMAMASVTSQVFLGVRISCAQCHNHPFDVWTRRDFYAMAAYFGKTRRFESNFTRVVYTSEADQTSVKWPPEDEAEMNERRLLKPSFPFPLIAADAHPEFITRYETLLAAKAAKLAQAESAGPSLDDLLADADEKVKVATSKGVDAGVAEAAAEISKIDVKGSLYRRSEYREQLAAHVTSPRNRLFAESFVNRVWKKMIGRGFVEPVDDFRGDNQASHPETLAFLADEFVAHGYSFKSLVKMIALSDVYQQKQAPYGVDTVEQEALEVAFLANPMRRMISESLYDSIVTAGHLFDVKHSPGQNERVYQEQVRVLVKDGESDAVATADVQNLADVAPSKAMENQNNQMKNDSGGGYRLEEAIELDFNALLMQDDEVSLDKMVAKSSEELEAERMAMQRPTKARPGMKYKTKTITRTVDSNPRFSSSLRMATPARVGHFVRVFGQTSRADLGEKRDDTPTMRQALMMLNGRLTHEASRVGDLEPVHSLLVGVQPQLVKAITLAYHEIYTRNPNEVEIEAGQQIISEAANVKAGFADLRWIMLNSNEFRFIP